MREGSMVYCARCGRMNPDDARFCIECGFPLHSEGGPTRTQYKQGFHIGSSLRGWRMARLLLGLVLVAWGLTQLLGINFIALLAIIMGLLIMLRALGIRLLKR
ncbi:MAG: zinc ribbon domain-containing protein [Candidatus Bathyarchaeia archaeon]